MIVNKNMVGLLKYLPMIIVIIIIMPRREGMLAIDLNMDISLFLVICTRGPAGGNRSRQG